MILLTSRNKLPYYSYYRILTTLLTIQKFNGPKITVNHEISKILPHLGNKKVEKKKKWKLFRSILSLLSSDLILANGLMSHFYLFC